MPYDPMHAAAYPANGRASPTTLSIFLTVFTNGKVTGDKVGPHTDLPHSLTWDRPTDVRRPQEVTTAHAQCTRFTTCRMSSSGSRPL
jgi:hypothetical protein